MWRRISVGDLADGSQIRPLSFFKANRLPVKPIADIVQVHRSVRIAPFDSSTDSQWEIRQKYSLLEDRYFSGVDM
jgi:hypothetical protein